MQNYAILIFSLISFILVKIILVKLKIKRRLQKAKHPLEQADKFLQKKVNQPLLKKMHQFPQIVKYNRQKINQLVQQQQCCNQKEIDDLIQYIAILIGILEQKNENDLMIKTLLETTNLNFPPFQSIAVDYIKAKQQQFDVLNIQKRKL